MLLEERLFKEMANKVSDKILLQKKNFREAIREVLADNRIYSDQEREECKKKIGSILGKRPKKRKK
jgi:hypothetical protein